MNRADKVHETIKACLLQEGDDASRAIVIKGIVREFYFDRTRLADQRPVIKELLTGLPKEFYKDAGGGWTFLNLCVDAEGTQWAEQPTAEALVAMGLATDLVSFQLPREFWSSLPGGVPYLMINLPSAPSDSVSHGVRRRRYAGDAI